MSTENEDLVVIQLPDNNTPSLQFVEAQEENMEASIMPSNAGPPKETPANSQPQVRNLTDESDPSQSRVTVVFPVPKSSDVERKKKAMEPAKLKRGRPRKYGLGKFRLRQSTSEKYYEPSEDSFWQKLPHPYYEDGIKFTAGCPFCILVVKPENWAQHMSSHFKLKITINDGETDKCVYCCTLCDNFKHESIREYLVHTYLHRRNVSANFEYQVVDGLKKKYKCRMDAECKDLVFEDKNTLQEHLSVHAKEAEDQAVGGDNTSAASNFRCYLCLLQLSSATELATHLRLHREGVKQEQTVVQTDIAVQNTGLAENGGERKTRMVKRYKCKECPEQFFREEDIKEHVRLHVRRKRNRTRKKTVTMSKLKTSYMSEANIALKKQKSKPTDVVRNEEELARNKEEFATAENCNGTSITLKTQKRKQTHVVRNEEEFTNVANHYGTSLKGSIVGSRKSIRPKKNKTRDEEFDTAENRDGTSRKGSNVGSRKSIRPKKNKTRDEEEFTTDESCDGASPSRTALLEVEKAHALRKIKWKMIMYMIVLMKNRK